jgi:hypothetical protein
MARAGGWKGQVWLRESVSSRACRLVPAPGAMDRPAPSVDRIGQLATVEQLTTPSAMAFSRFSASNRMLATSSSGDDEGGHGEGGHHGRPPSASAEILDKKSEHSALQSGRDRDDRASVRELRKRHRHGRHTCRVSRRTQGPVAATQSSGRGASHPGFWARTVSDPRPSAPRSRSSPDWRAHAARPERCRLTGRGGGI